LYCAALYHHSGEVLSLGACSADGSLISTVYDNVPVKKGTVWRRPPLLEEGGEPVRNTRGGRAEPPAQELVAVGDVPDVPGWSLLHLVWTPPAAEGLPATHLLAVFDRGLRVYDVRADGLSPVCGVDFEEREVSSYCGGAAWDPHHPFEVALALDGHVRTWEVRSGEGSRAIMNVVAPGCGVVRAISYNPNRPWFLATGGDDMRIKCWDVRRPESPLKVLEGHAHW
jgi:WD40 repeat protein